MNDLSPLSFRDPREYLVAIFAHRKTKNSRYSMRAWAQRLGYRNSSLLTDVLKGRRHLSIDIRARLIQNLKLSNEEQEYFELLCLMSDTKSSNERHLYLKRSLALNPKMESTSLALDRFLTIKDWYHLTILEMIDLKNFCEDHSQIARQLGEGVTRTMVKSAIDRLIRLDILQRDKNGKLVREQKHLCIGGTIPDSAIREHHEQFIDKAKIALSEQSIEERDFSGSTISVHQQDLKKIKDLIDQFHEDIHRIGCRPAADAVYRVNVQMFKVTKGNINGKPV